VGAHEIGLSLALALGAPVALFAHEGHTHKVMGSVAAVATDRIEVATSDGLEVVTGLNEQTRYLVGDEPAVAADVKVGGRAVVISVGQGGRAVARQVLLPPARSER
jgi:hypothetical protein